VEIGKNGPRILGVNHVYACVIHWPIGDEMRAVILDFKAFCSMHSVHGALDCTHIHISKLAHFLDDYYYFKTGGYSMVDQAVVDTKKMFQNIYVGLPGSVNDQRVLQKSTLWQNVVHGGLLNFDAGSQDVIPPYFLADKGYPLLSWCLTLF
jgi:hypothetical protein